jgi:hypothetical protein
VTYNSPTRCTASADVSANSHLAPTGSRAPTNADFRRTYSLLSSGVVAAAAMAHCGKSLDEPSYIEHPFQQHWLPFDSESPTEPDARRQSDAEVAVTIPASSVNSALVAVLFVVCAFGVASSPPATCRGSRSSRSAAARRTRSGARFNLYCHSNVC